VILGQTFDSMRPWRAKKKAAAGGAANIHNFIIPAFWRFVWPHGS
jgi:hypothetical protein